MKKIALIALTIILCQTSFGQVSGYFGKKNIITFKSKIGVGYSNHRSRVLGKDGIAREKIQVIDPVFELGYERILTRRITLGLSYTFGFGRTGFKTSTSQIHNPWYNSHNFTINAYFYRKAFAPIGSYLRAGLGAGVVGTKGRVTYGQKFTNQPAIISNSFLIDVKRPVFTMDFAWGKNWPINKWLLFNFEVGTRFNLVVDGKHDFDFFNLFEGALAWMIYGYLIDESPSIERDLYVRKAHADILTLNVGFKFLL